MLPRCPRLRLPLLDTTIDETRGADIGHHSSDRRVCRSCAPVLEWSSSHELVSDSLEKCRNRGKMVFVASNWVGLRCHPGQCPSASSVEVLAI